MPPPTSAVTITPARSIRGHLRVPGDKAISHRYALLAALAEGPSHIFNFAPGGDCRSTLSCLRQLGVDATDGRARADGPASPTTVMGRGPGQLRSPAAPLDAHNSGTTMRLLAGVLAGQPMTATMVGDSSLTRRPMRRVIVPLEQMGARIDSNGGRPPLTIFGGRLHGITHRPEVPSAQVKSAVLLAGLFAEGSTTVTEPAATRDHTERALPVFGATVVVDGATITVRSQQTLVGRTLHVPGDFSSAAFWLAAAAALPESRIEIEDVGLNPSRTRLVDILRRFGARVQVEVMSSEAGESRGTIVVEHERAGHLTIGPDEVPGLIDELPAIAAMAAHGGGVTVTGAAELRVKETDRIAALVTGFRAMGIDADERPDGFVVSGYNGSTGRRQVPSSATKVMDAKGDHRMAMAFAIAALGGGAPSTIDGADVVNVSYPGFFEVLGRLVV